MSYSKVLHKTTLRVLAAGVLLAVAGSAQTAASSGKEEAAPAFTGTPAFTSVTPQYNFAYAPSASQPLLGPPTAWSYYFPGQANSSTPGWTTGMYGTSGIPDAYYNQPYYSGTTHYAGGSTWNASYNSPPYWFIDYMGSYKEYVGPVLVGGGAVGSTYQSATQELSGSGVPVYGIGASQSWNQNDDFSPPADYIGALYFTSHAGGLGGVEYGFAHYFDTKPVPVDQFYFYYNDNCPETAGGSVCYTTPTSKVVADQCQAAVNIPTLEQNSRNNFLYVFYAYVSINASNGHYIFNAGIQDPYSQETVWNCTADPSNTSNTFTNCPNQSVVNYNCNGTTSGSQFYAFPTSSLYPASGSVTVGISNVNNQPPTGESNPALTMLVMWILEQAL